MRTTKSFDIFVKKLNQVNWDKMNADEKLVFLQSFENIMAEMEGRDALKIGVIPTVQILKEPGLMGYFNGSGIYINPKYLKTPLKIKGVSQFTMAGALQVIAHEGRHAWQRYVVDHPEKNLTDRKTRLSIMMNFENYNSEDTRYGAQLIELDARRFAKKILQTMNDLYTDFYGEKHKEIDREYQRCQLQERAWASALLRDFSEKDLIEYEIRARKISESRHPGVDFSEASIFEDAKKWLKYRDYSAYIDGEPIAVRGEKFSEAKGKELAAKADSFRDYSDERHQFREHKKRFM